MNFIAVAETDKGTTKPSNQDSFCIRMAQTSLGPAFMAVICDGMGGLAKGELASATVIRSFARWFEEEFPSHTERLDWQTLSEKWHQMLKNENEKILRYGQQNNIQLGTTMTGMLAVGNRYMSMHIGDSRIYKIHRNVTQLTEDHTVVAREVKQGRLTPEQARKDPRRNILLQCIGVNTDVVPDVAFGELSAKCVYMLCTDGFRHEVSVEELKRYLNPFALDSGERMKENARYLIDLVKSRQEKDNITVLLIRTD